MNEQGAMRAIASTDELVPGEIALTPTEKAVLDRYKPDYRLEILKRLRAGIYRIRPGRGQQPELVIDSTRQERRAAKSKKARRRIAADSRRRNR